MKIIFILCRSRYRKNNLNNFSKILKLNKYLIITLFGPLYYLGLFLKKFSFFKFISIDADPIIEKKSGINFWLTGTNQKITKSLYHLENNFVNMKSVFHNEDKVFQVYPIIKKNKKNKNNAQIIYISNCNIRKPELSLSIINSYQEILSGNLLAFDKKNFWELEELKFKEKKEKYLIYRDLKINQRMEIVKYIKDAFPIQFFLFGDEWKTHFQDCHKTVMKKDKIQSLYNGNICLDLGSSSGSLTLYPRSIEIIESGGLILQLKQSDSKSIFQEYEDYFTFQTKEDLKNKIHLLLENNSLLKERIKILRNIFKNSRSLIEKQLDHLF